MVGSLIFGLIFGFPFITWGLFLIFDRDRTWQKQLEKSRANKPPIRTPAWDKKQIIYGSILVIVGLIITIFFTLGNYIALSISPTL